MNRYATESVNITLPHSGEPGSLNDGRSIAIDTTPPTVTGVTSTYPDGTYTVGATIGIAVAFSAPVVLHGYGGLCNDNRSTSASSTSSNVSSGAGVLVACDDVLPTLLMDSSGELGDRNATYAEGNGTTQLIFAYEVYLPPTRHNCCSPNV